MYYPISFGWEVGLVVPRGLKSKQESQPIIVQVNLVRLPTMKPIKRSRWLVMLASCWIQCFNGFNFAFNIYSQGMKAALHYDQKTLSSISAFSSAGGLFGLIPAYLYELVPQWLLILMGSAMASFSYVMIWLAMAGAIDGASWKLCIYHFLKGLSVMFFQVAVYVTSLKIFPARNGNVAGLLKGYYGLGSSVAVQLFYLFCGGDQTCFPWMLSWLLPLGLVIGMFAVRSVPTAAAHDKNEASNFYMLSGMLVAVIAYLFGVTLLQSCFAFTHTHYLIVCLIFMLLVLLPFAKILQSDLRDEVEPNPLLGDVQESSEESSSKSNHLPVDDPLLTVTRVLCSVDFWLFMVATVLGDGTLGAVDSNLAQLGDSLGYSPKMISICVSLFYLSGSFSRIGVGLLSDHCLQTYGTQRLVFLMLAMLANSAGTMLVAVPVRGAFAVNAILSGISQGVQWCLKVSITSDLFGLRSFNILFNIAIIAYPVGTYIFSVLIVGYLYDEEASRDYEGSLFCHGSHCFRAASLVLAASSLTGAGICGILAMRMKGLYRSTGGGAVGKH